MRMGYLRTRTVRALYLIAASFTVVVIGLGIFIVMGMSLLPAATTDLPIR